MTNPNYIVGHFEGLAFNVAGAVAVASARANARVAAVHADRAEVAALGDVARVARAMTSDRLEIRRLQAENAALRSELHGLRVREGAVALRDRRRVA